MTLLTLKLQNPGSGYCCGSILDELGNEIATNVDEQLTKEAGQMTIDTSKGNCAPWDETEVEANVTDVLGFELAYHILGNDPGLRCNASEIDQYAKKLWKEVLCLS